MIQPQDKPTKWYCQYCGRYRILTKDHFYPRSYMRYLAEHDPWLWGVIVKDNIVMACTSCQRLKADKHPEQWAKIVPTYGAKFVREKIQLLRAAKLDMVTSGKTPPKITGGTGLNRQQRHALRNYDPVQALHRAMRSHQWQIWKLAKGGIYQGERKKSWWFAEFYCLCGVRKFFVRDSIGRLVGHPRYEYPDTYRLADLGLSPQEINEQLWLFVFEHELASETIGQLKEMQHERKAGQ